MSQTSQKLSYLIIGNWKPTVLTYSNSCGWWHIPLVLNDIEANSECLSVMVEIELGIGFWDEWLYVTDYFEFRNGLISIKILQKFNVSASFEELVFTNQRSVEIKIS